MGIPIPIFGDRVRHYDTHAVDVDFSVCNGRLWLDAEEIDEAPATVTGISDDGGEREEWT